MRRAEKARRVYETRLCPCCGEELYADVEVCYGCLYDFSRPLGAAPALPEPGAGTLGGPEPGAYPPEGLPGDTEDLSEAARRARAETRVGLWVRSASLGLWTPVPPEGVVLGRAPDCDVVLCLPSVSRRHVRLVPTEDGMQVEDLGATNPVVYRGREVRRPLVVPYGDALELCGLRLVVTGERSLLAFPAGDDPPDA